ncbi:MAG TPA: DUF4388 domain-containing protein [Thermomicrobiaceae bacterium]|nr:DUF4388 domain-containing protein [Thermomicrobiaceae bacterium]
MTKTRELESDIDLQGRLAAFSISDLLQMLSFTRKTGTVTLIQGWNSRTVTFEEGRISYVAAGSRLPSLTELLLRLGKVSREQVEGLYANGIRSEDAVLRHLLEAGTVDEADLRRCQEQLLEISIYTLFLWRNCVFTFNAEEVVREGGVAVDVDSMQIIIEGTRRVDEWIEVSPVVPSVYMIFRSRRRQPIGPPPFELRLVFALVDGQRDVVAIAREAGLTQFQTARALFHLVRAGYIEAVPPNKHKVIELFNRAVESIYMKLCLYDHARVALEFENQLNRFAIENRLKVRMAAGKIIISDQNTAITPTELVDLYKLFIAIQNNKFSKMFEPVVAHGLIDGLYRHSDPELQQMMRMYEFVELEGLLLLEMFDRPQSTGMGTGTGTGTGTGPLPPLGRRRRDFPSDNRAVSLNDE